MKKDNKLPLSVIAKSVTIIVEGKKPLAQQLNNVAVQRNYSKKAVGYSRSRKPSVHRLTVKAGRAGRDRVRRKQENHVLPDGIGQLKQKSTCERKVNFDREKSTCS